MLVPKLRFKQFNDEWKAFKIQDTFVFLSTNSLSRDKLNYELGTTKNIHYGDIHTILPTICDVSKETLPYINNDIIYKNINLLKNNDLLIADASENYNDIGKAIEVIEINNQKVVGGLHTLILRCNLNLFASKFKGYLFNTDNVRTQIKILSAGAKVLGISKDNLKKITFYLPSLEEQSKIADFLSLIDKKLELQEKLVDNLKLYKKGLLKKVFSNNKGWKSDKLGDICEIVMGQSPNSENYNNTNKGMPLIQGNADIFNRKTNPKNYTTQITKTCDIGDILISVRAPVGNVAISNHYACIGRGMCKLLTKLNKKYIYQYLLAYENCWDKISQGSTFQSISSSDIYNFIVKYPSIEEQNRIANLFSNLDKKIELETKKLQDLKTYKKGLLQKMFI